MLLHNGWETLIARAAGHSLWVPPSSLVDLTLKTITTADPVVVAENLLPGPCSWGSAPPGDCDSSQTLVFPTCSGWPITNSDSCGSDLGQARFLSKTIFQNKAHRNAIGTTSSQKSHNFLKLFHRCLESQDCPITTKKQHTASITALPQRIAASQKPKSKNGYASAWTGLLATLASELSNERHMRALIFY